MEYCEAGTPVSSEQTDSAGHQPSTSSGEPVPDAAEVFAALLNEEKQAITVQCRIEAERDIHRARAAIVEAISEFASQRNAYFLQVEGEVVQLALSISRRILHRETQIDPKLLLALVEHELNQIDKATIVRLLVPPDAQRYWQEAASKMAREVQVEVDRTISVGSLRIETALGALAIDFEDELKEIERGLFDVLSRRPLSADDPRTTSVQ
jgi:flagellar biosynthesis/type III secretory pathway protein FliH